MKKIYQKQFDASDKKNQIELFIAHKKKVGVIAVFIGVVITSIATTIWFFQEQQLLSPITQTTTFKFLSGKNYSDPSQKKVVYGFLPYWNINKTALHPELTHLAYFGLEIGADGNIITQNDQGTEPGFSKLKSEIFFQLVEGRPDQQTKTELVLIQFNNDDIVSLLSSERAQQQLLENIDALLLAYPFSGINIDIEYSGKVTNYLRERMTVLVTTINHHLDSKYDKVELSIDMYASAAESNSIWDVEKISPQVDYIIIMAYDFHRRSSAVAGPVAPIFGGKTLWDSDINYHLKEFTKLADKNKLLLGVPFYGYEWQTTSDDPQALTIPNTGVTASYQRIQEVLEKKEELGVQEHWNEDALSPYLVYEENSITHIIYYDNSRSLSYKLDFVNQLNLKGIAIWALGYEGDYRELWDIIERKLNFSN